MPRKPVPSDIQKNVLLKSRRRCCLCFWLDGRDENQKGQVAHLDHNNRNVDEDNLVFLCLEHHDEYDGKTSVAKGLREDEVRHWRDELYKEMEYRFRTVKKRDFELRIVGFLYAGAGDGIKARLRLTNTGETSARSPTVTMRLPEGVKGVVPTSRNELSFGLSVPMIDPYAMTESREDIFEPNGRVAIKTLGGINPVLMPGHSFTFEGLLFHLAEYKPGTEFELKYRVDAEDMPPVLGKVVARVPSTLDEFLASDEDEEDPNDRDR